jgi:hypothetical protein
MLSLKGGWEIAPLEKDLYIFKTPYRWTDLLLTKTASSVEKLTNGILESDVLSDSSVDFKEKREQLDRLQTAVEEFLGPITENVNTIVEKTFKDPRVRDAVRLLDDIQKQLKDSSSVEFPDLKSYIDRFSSILPGEVGDLLQRYITEKDMSSEISSKALTESDYGRIESDSRGLADEEDKSGMPILKDTKFFEMMDFNSLGSTGTTSRTDRNPIVVPSDEFKRLKDRGDVSKEEQQLMDKRPWLKNLDVMSRVGDGQGMMSSDMNAAEVIIESY